MRQEISAVILHPPDINLYIIQLIMVALWNRIDHYIFILWILLLLSFYLSFFLA